MKIIDRNIENRRIWAQVSDYIYKYENLDELKHEQVRRVNKKYNAKKIL